MKATPLHMKICHFRYCRIITGEDSYTVNFKKINYKLVFKHIDFRTGTGLLIKRLDKKNIPDSDFLLWLSVYIGEDFINPFQDVDTRFVSSRGDFYLKKEALQNFLSAAERLTARKWPLWKKDLLDNAITYFSVGVRSGVNYMPLTLGFFALSLECLGNVSHGVRNKHYTFGNKKFRNLASARLARFKQDPNVKAKIKNFEKRMDEDIELLNVLRNAFYEVRPWIWTVN